MIASEAALQEARDLFSLETQKDLLCWQHGILNFYRIALFCSKPEEFPSLIFVTKDRMDHTYFVYNHQVFNAGVTWEKKEDWNLDLSINDLLTLCENGEAHEITNICLESQLGYMTGTGGHHYWRAVRNLDKRIGVGEPYLSNFTRRILMNESIIPFQEKFTRE